MWSGARMVWWWWYCWKIVWNHSGWMGAHSMESRNQSFHHSSLVGDRKNYLLYGENSKKLLNQFLITMYLFNDCIISTIWCIDHQLIMQMTVESKQQVELAILGLHFFLDLHPSYWLFLVLCLQISRLSQIETSHHVWSTNLIIVRGCAFIYGLCIFGISRKGKTKSFFLCYSIDFWVSTCWMFIMSGLLTALCPGY